MEPFQVNRIIAWVVALEVVDSAMGLVDDVDDDDDKVVVVNALYMDCDNVCNTDNDDWVDIDEDETTKERWICMTYKSSLITKATDAPLGDKWGSTASPT